MSSVESSTVISTGKVNHALKLLSSLENMKKRTIVCDFAIAVKGKSFSVHRAVLIACSTYFDGLFSSDMKEVREGCIAMKGVTSEGVEYSIEFMYTGEVKVTSSNVQSILEASHLMQLDDLIKICLQYLRDNLSVTTALLTVKLFQLYGTNEDQISADEYVISYLEEVIQTDMFPLITKEDLMRYLQAANLDPEIHWQAIVLWMEQNKEEKERFLPKTVGNLLEMSKISLTFLIESLWKHSLVQNNDDAKALILKELSENEDNLEKVINLETCFSLKKIAKRHDFVNSDRWNKALDKYLAKKFEQAIKKDEFHDLSLKDLTSVLCSEHLLCQEESVKWEALLKWVKHVKSREKNLPDLMKILNFDRIPAEYTHRNIRNEPLVKKLEKCKDILLDALYAQMAASQSRAAQAPAEYQPSTLVMLAEGSGILTAVDVENGNHTEITRVEKESFSRITSVRGELYLFQNEKLYNYSNTGNWRNIACLGIKHRASAQVVNFRDQIYVIDKDSMSCYDPSKNIWTEKLPGCGLEEGFCVAASEYSIYALGGETTDREARRFDPESRRWLMIAPMQGDIWDAAAIVYHEKLYVMGGLDNSLQSYNRFSDTWEDLGNMNESRTRFGAAVYNDKLYVVGGACDEDFQRLDEDSIEVFKEDEETNKWEIVQTLPKSRGRMSACVCKLFK